MAEQGDVLTDLDLDPAPNGADNQPSAGIIAQYVKDMSVEVPHAPECFQWKDSPQVDVQFNIAARQVENEIHEVELKIVATAHAEQGKAFIVELAYCGLLGMRTCPRIRRTPSSTPKPRASCFPLPAAFCRTRRATQASSRC